MVKLLKEDEVIINTNMAEVMGIAVGYTLVFNVNNSDNTWGIKRHSNYTKSFIIKINFN